MTELTRLLHEIASGGQVEVSAKLFNHVYDFFTGLGKTMSLTPAPNDGWFVKLWR